MSCADAVRRPKNYLLLVPPLLSAIILFTNHTTPGISYDGHTYLQIARNIHYGIGLGWQALWASPLHSVLIAMVSCLPGVHEPQVAAGIVGTLMGVVLTSAVCFLACELFDRRVAVAAGLITAVFPHFCCMAGSIEPEITYTALLVLSLAMMLVTLRRASLLQAAATGGCFALTYLVRSEGFLVMLFVLALTTAASWSSERRTTVFRLTAMVVVSFLLFSLPYLVFLRQGYGSWVISPKSTYVLNWMKWRTYHDNEKGESDNDDLWGLTTDGRLKWQQPSGAGDLVAYLMSHPAKSLKVYLHNISQEIPGRIPNNSGSQHYPQVFPVILSLCALFAAFRRWGNDSAVKKAVLYGPLLILLILPVYTIGWWKYLVPYSPLVIIAGCAGILLIISRLTASDKQIRWAFAATTAVLVFWFWYSAFPPRTSSAPSAEAAERGNYSKEAEQAGRWIAKKLGPGQNFMVKWGKMVYFLDGIWTAAPVADFPELLAYARSQGARYYIREIAPDTAPADIVTPPAGLAFHLLYHSPTSEYMVAVYRFTPP